MSKQGLVYYHDLLSGTITETDEGYEFSYSPLYLDSKNAQPISLTLPLTKEKIYQPGTVCFF